jgi:hypothetical protein
MSEKIVYLLGAGASAGSNSISSSPQYVIPITKELPGHFEQLISVIEKRSYNIIPEQKSGSESDLREFCQNLRWLAQGSRQFGSPDTFAKYLYINNKMKELKKLKVTLSFYLAYIQLYDKKIDDRYITLFTTLINKGLKFPEHVKFLTWNYDFQILSAITKIIDTSNEYWPKFEDRLDNIFRYYPSKIGKKAIDTLNYQQLSLLYLNGVAGHYSYGDNEIMNYCGTNMPLLAESLVSREEPLISFGWEERNMENILETAKSMLENTTVLVVIGYTFPFFNREIDKKIIQYANNNGTLKKIYVQDPYYDGQNIRSQFNIGIPVVQIREVNQLFVPYEL